MNKYYKSSKKNRRRHSSSSSSNEKSESDEEEEEDSELNDDVFEQSESETIANANKKKKEVSVVELSELYEHLEKMKYLDMFVREVLRMFPIANSMVSRKCVNEEGLHLDQGNYFVPKGMNICVDVLSIHYDRTHWGPVS